MSIKGLIVSSIIIVFLVKEKKKKKKSISEVTTSLQIRFSDISRVQ